MILETGTKFSNKNIESRLGDDIERCLMKNVRSWKKLNMPYIIVFISLFEDITQEVAEEEMESREEDRT